MRRVNPSTGLSFQRSYEGLLAMLDADPHREADYYFLAREHDAKNTNWLDIDLALTALAASGHPIPGASQTRSLRTLCQLALAFLLSG